MCEDLRIGVARWYTTDRQEDYLALGRDPGLAAGDSTTRVHANEM